jgi:UDP-N-acetylglucosamine:LPS N-acetylglucosamine transferase
MKTRVLFFSRGRGRGHAIPDIAIAQELSALCPQIEISFVSYSTGAATFRSANYAVHDLNLPEKNEYLATLFKAVELIGHSQPTIVVAHEEFAAVAAAHLSNTPSIFISAWLPKAGNIAAESLAYASSIIIIDDPGVFALPAGVAVQPIYVGPILRKMRYTVSDRPHIRAQMGLEEGAFVVLVVSGGAVSEQQSPIADIVLAAYLKLRKPVKRMFWLASGNSDFELLRARMAGIEGCEVLKFFDPVEQLMAVADVVITRGTRGATLDAASVGVPSLSLSPGLNPIDDVLVPRIRTNIALSAKAVDGDILCHYIEKAVHDPLPVSERRSCEKGAEGAAKVLSSEIRRLSARGGVIGDSGVPEHVSADGAIEHGHGRRIGAAESDGTAGIEKL